MRRTERIIEQMRTQEIIEAGGKAGKNVGQQLWRRSKWYITQNIKGVKEVGNKLSLAN